MSNVLIVKPSTKAQSKNGGIESFSMADDILIHIGMPKCASTTLQKHLFCNLKNVQNFGLYPTGNVAGNNKIYDFEHCVYLSDERLFGFYKALHNEPNVNLLNLNKQWQEILAQNRTGSHLPVLLSHEALTSCFFSQNSQREKAKRLKTLFPNARILLIIRNQLDWLRSQYADHPFDPRNFSQGKAVCFDEWVSIFLNDKNLTSARNSLRYNELIGLYARKFGEDMISVLAFEDLTYKQEVFFRSLSAFLSTDVQIISALLDRKHENRSVSRTYNFFRKKIRSASKRSFQYQLIHYALKLNFLKKLPEKKYTLSKNTLESLINFYSADNLELKNKIDIADYNYPSKTEPSQ